MEEGGKGRQMALTTINWAKHLSNCRQLADTGLSLPRAVVTGVVRTGMTRDMGFFFSSGFRWNPSSDGLGIR